MGEFIAEIIFELFFLPLFESTSIGKSRKQFYVHAVIRSVLYLLIIAVITWVSMISFMADMFFVGSLFVVFTLIAAYCLFRSSVHSILNFKETHSDKKTDIEED